MTQIGLSEGEICNREKQIGAVEMCPGLIKSSDVEGCYCHLSAPCGQCVEPREYCPICDWEA